jgi:hypothetical protein
VRRSIVRILLTAVLAGTLTPSVPRKAGSTRLKVPVMAPPNVVLGLNDIQAAVGDTPVNVISLATPSEDLIVMMVLDLAGDLPMGQRVKEALLNELDKLPPHAHVALLSAQDSLRVIEDPTADRSAIKTAIELLTIGGRAGLLDSIETATRIADSILAKSAVRLAILYITDSDIKNYRQDFTNPVINSSDAGDLSRKFPEALIQEKISKLDANLARSQAPVFIVHTQYRSDRLNEAYFSGLRQLASTSGGMTIVCRFSADIQPAIKDVLAVLANHYSVTLELPKVQTRSIDLRLTITGPDGNQHDLPYRSRFVLKNE